MDGREYNLPTGREASRIRRSGGLTAVSHGCATPGRGVLFRLGAVVSFAEVLESRRLLSASAPLDVTGSFAGTAKLKPAVHHAHSAKYALTLTLTDTAGAVTGTGSLTGLTTADFTVAGTLSRKRKL